jgi:hypothetical protein
MIFVETRKEANKHTSFGFLEAASLFACSVRGHRLHRKEAAISVAFIDPLSSHRDENELSTRVRESITDVMKVSHNATIAFLSASAIGMTGAVSVVARQFTIERSAVQVVVDTSIASRLQGLSDAMEHVPDAERPLLLSRYRFKNETALAAALTAQPRDLDSAEKLRAAELAANVND